MDTIDKTNEHEVKPATPATEHEVKPATPATEEAEKTAEEAKLAAEQEALVNLLATPLPKEAAEKDFADLDVRRTQLAVIRQKWLSQAEVVKQQLTQIQQKISMLDEELYTLELDRAIVFRRTLNTPEK